MTERELMDLIDRYREGELSGKELSDFEERLKNEPLLAKMVNEQKIMVKQLEHYGDRKRLKNQMDKFHKEMAREKSPSEKKGFFKIKRTYIAMAASLAAVVLSVFSFYAGSFYSQKKEVASEYKELSVKMDEIEAKQEEIIKDINDKDNSVVNNGSTPQTYFSGTGTLISNEGYVLTCYHLVKNAKAISLENKIAGKISAIKVFEDKTRDIAILKVDKEKIKSLGSIPFSMKTRNVDLAEKVFTLGFPGREVVYGEGTVSAGSGFHGDTLAYQISIPLNPGNSGGALFDEQGNIVGIISGKQTGAELANFAVKTKYIIELLYKMEGDKKISLSKKNLVYSLKRSEQIKKLRPFVFNVRVY
ncbi:MAG: serine protease [Cytophagaceae bacterium]|nr:serine protease [Cytophagaceae bacterium]